MSDDIVIYRGNGQQSANDTLTSIEIPTGLGITDQRTVWEILKVQVQWSESYSLTAVTNFVLAGILSRENTTNTVFDKAALGGVYWAGCNGVATMGSFVPIDIIKEQEFLDQPIVANSKLFFNIQSAGTSKKNTLHFNMYYRVKKVTEVEFLKAQSAYCIC